MFLFFDLKSFFQRQRIGPNENRRLKHLFDKKSQIWVFLKLLSFLLPLLPSLANLTDFNETNKKATNDLEIWNQDERGAAQEFLDQLRFSFCPTQRIKMRTIWAEAQKS